jgi:cellulose synthase/poly-beta-1,6-N-acetylglucosamine synthase-like glycosyltransferase
MSLLDWPLLFWLSAVFVLYTYVGYPLCLIVLRAIRRPRPAGLAEAATPFLSIILTIRNEAAHIGAKLENLLTLDYPADRFEILVASDGSTDRTPAIVRGFADPRVRLVEYFGGLGKSECVNRTVPLARGPVLVLMDVRQAVHPDALRALAAHFADASVGLVGAEMVIVDAVGNATTEGTGLYWRFERWIRGLEAELGLLTGVSGCCYAVRKEVFRPIPPGSYCEDVTMVLYARSSGWKVRWERSAQVYEPLRDQRVEFGRKVRTLVGNYQLITQFWRLYLPWRGTLAFTLLSHKVCRLLIPLALLLLLGSSAVLAPASPLYLGALLGQLGIYGLGLLGLASAGSRRRLRLANACGTFCLLNGAALMAFIHVLRHGPRIGWR